MITTIQLPKELKDKLDGLKEKKSESYADILARIIKREEKLKRMQLFEEYGQKYGEESRKEVNEWEDNDWYD